ncbi:uncharacterized protein [Mytilus edulis]|uniref:uncharacterized protein isoform X1 n=2 Tax=Mytilus edulis TaxID=6550 RepID=UPI0039F050FA
MTFCSVWVNVKHSLFGGSSYNCRRQEAAWSENWDSDEESEGENAQPWRFWRRFSLRRGDKGKRDLLHREDDEKYDASHKLFPDENCKRTNSLKPPPKPPRLFLFRSSSISTPRSSFVGPPDRNSFVMSQAYQSSRARDSNVPTAHVVPVQKENGTISKQLVNNNNIQNEIQKPDDEKPLINEFDTIMLGSPYSSSKIKIVTPDLNPRRTIGRSRKMSVDVSSSDSHRLVIQNASELLCQTLDPTILLDELSEKQVVSAIDYQAFKGHPDRRLVCESLMQSLMEGTLSQFTSFCDVLKSKLTYEDIAVILDVMKETYDIIFNIPVTGVCSTGIPDEDKSITFEIGYFNNQLGKLKPLVQLEKARDYKRYSRDSMLLKRSSRISYMSSSSDTTLIDEVAGLDLSVPMINISISGYSLRGSRAKAVATLIEKYDCILELHVGKTQMQGADIGTLAVGLPKSNISVLDLRLNSVGNDGAKLLSCFLQKNASIKNLNLSSTGVDSDGFKNICEALKHSTCINELDFSFLEVADSGCIAIGNMLKQNRSLTKLRLRSANISWIGCGILFEGVQQSKTLIELDMSRNFIGDDGIEMMCRHLNDKTSLLELNLENCGITASGCSLLADVIQSYKTIKNLDLSSNFIADSGISKLAASLERNKSIKTLGLNMCGITNDGFSKLLDVLECNPTITLMKLCYNRLGREFTNPAAASDDLRYRVRIVTSSNPKLKLLLWGNAFDDA